MSAPKDSSPEEAAVKPLTSQQIALLRVHFDQHCVANASGKRFLCLRGFCTFAVEVDLPLAQQSELHQAEAFHSLARRIDGEVSDGEPPVSVNGLGFDDLCIWASEAGDANALALHQNIEREDASFWGGVSRLATAATRPLSQVFAQCQYAMVLVAKKFAVVLKQAMTNPTRLFKRKAMSTMEVFKMHPEGVVGGLRAELSVGGMRGITRKAFGPLLANSVVAMSMFHTYSSTKTALAARAAKQDDSVLTPLRIECLAGATAGVVQGSLHAPLYNLKLRHLRKQDPQFRQPGGIIRGAYLFYQSRGFLVFYRNYPYIVSQEACTLAMFFGSYEFFKMHLSQVVREHIDPTGKKDMYVWAVSASAAGIVLAGLGTPFENVLEWHVARRDAGSSLPKSVLGHFWHSARKGTHRRILFSGMRRRLPMAPVAGLPLLVYEALMQGGAVPVLHSEDEVL